MPHRILKRKARGGHRVIYEFNAFGIAKQTLFVMAVRPFASFHPSQYTLRRGRPAACESLLKTMNLVLPRNTRFIRFDVDDCYGSFSREWLEEHLPAPKAMIRSTLFLDGWLIVDRVRGYKPMGRQGLPQGSVASSFVAEMVIAEVLRCAAGPFRSFVGLVNYSDNVGGLVPHDTDVAALEVSIKHAFLHPAGPFRLTFSRPCILGEEFRFLGYSFVREEGHAARVFLPEDQWKFKAVDFIANFANANTEEELIEVVRQVQSYCAAFSLAGETAILRRRVIEFMRQDLAYRVRRVGGDAQGQAHHIEADASTWQVDPPGDRCHIERLRPLPVSIPPSLPRPPAGR